MNNTKIAQGKRVMNTGLVFFHSALHDIGHRLGDDTDIFIRTTDSRYANAFSHNALNYRQVGRTVAKYKSIYASMTLHFYDPLASQHYNVMLLNVIMLVIKEKDNEKSMRNYVERMLLLINCLT